MKKILFLNGNSKNEFYNNERNKYKGVEATSIFKTNNIYSKVTRRLLLKFNLPGIELLFDDWKNNIHEYNTIIISTCMYSKLIYKYIRKRTNAKIIHWYWNPIIDSINPEEIKSNDCEVWSFDEKDCKDFDLNYIPTYYFNTIELPKQKIIHDIYFIGADKGRLNKLKQLEEEFIQRGLKTKFHITKSKNSDDNTYKFKSPISYYEALKDISSSKAILDYVQEGQSGLTQRPMESIFYNKKLITNDRNIVKYDFYNKNNIFIIGMDDIDNINCFLNSPYEPISEEIIKKYDFGTWLKNITIGLSV